MANTLIVPGLNNSGPAHWQSLWQLKRPDYVRVVQRDWSEPRLDEWAASLDRAIRKGRGKSLIVAHSYGCLATLRRLQQRSDDVAGVMLVAPADPEKWGQTPFSAIAVPSVLVASRNDPWLEFDKAKSLAATLGAAFVNLGMAGHVNAESGYGPWEQGERILDELLVQAVRNDKVERQLALAAAL
jgi:hypothetical protein